jgi:sugar/nucleoside kinase (ribokinase family)
MTRPLDVVTVGDAFQDIIMTGFPAFPRPGEEAYADRLDREIGGGAPITACGLARLGVRVALLSCVGASDCGWLADALSVRAVDVSLLQRHPSLATAVTVSISTPENRTFFTYSGANAALRLESEAVPEGVRWVHLALRPSAGMFGVVRSLRARGISVSLDVGWHPDWLRDRSSYDLLREIDLFFPNDLEAEAMTGSEKPDRALAILRDAGLRRVALKRGAAGASLLWDGAVYRCPAWPVACCDTTGAGDCFDAGFLAALLQGAPPAGCLAAGVFCGSMSTRVPGGVNGFPSKSEFDEWNNRQR